MPTTKPDTSPAAMKATATCPECGEVRNAKVIAGYGHCLTCHLKGVR